MRTKNKDLGSAYFLVIVAIIVLGFVGGTLQTMGFCSYFTGRFALGMIEAEPSPEIRTIYRILAIGYGALAFGALIPAIRKGAASGAWATIIVVVAFLASGAGPFLAGYIQSAIGQSFLTAAIPKGSRSLTESQRGIIVSFSNGGGDGRYVVMPADFKTHRADEFTLYFVDKTTADVREEHTGRLHPKAETAP